MRVSNIRPEMLEDPGTGTEMVSFDGNEAAAWVAYRLSEVCAIYPITPSSTMAELADEWAAQKIPNLWGHVPTVVEMQHEGGAAGAVHGALQAGSLSTTFTASQGLMLMLPNMYKIAGELTPTVFHVAARSLAAQGLSIFGDHQDVMAARTTGFALLASASVQEAHDLALVAHAATLEARIPFIHFFDGFRTSHEVNKIHRLEEATLARLVDDDLVLAHYRRALNPDAPVMRGTAQNPDTYFQARESVNSFYEAVPGIVQKKMDQLAEETGRALPPGRLLRPSRGRVGDRLDGLRRIHRAADRGLAECEARTAATAGSSIRLYRPFPAEALLEALPRTARRIAVLDRTKEPGANGEPMYQDVMTALAQGLSAGAIERMPLVAGGRYGLSSKEFTPAMVKAVFANLDSRRAEAPFHGRHQRRHHAPEPGGRRGLRHRAGQCRARHVLRPRRRRHGGRQQEQHQDHRRRPGTLRAGLLRLRFEEIGGADRVAPALRPAADRGALPAAVSQFHRLPPVRFRLQQRYPGPRRERRHPVAEQPLPTGRTLAEAARAPAAADRRQGHQAVHDRRLPGGAGHRHGPAHQHHHAGLLLQAGRRHGHRRGHRGDQESDREDLQQEGRGDRREELRCRRPGPLAPAQGGRRRGAAQRHWRTPAGTKDRADLRARRDRRDDGRPRRRPAGFETAGRRHLPDRHQPVGKAQHRAVHPRMAGGPLHPVRQLLLRLPARGDPRQVLPRKRVGGGAGQLPVDADQCPRLSRNALRAAGLPGRLHRLQAVRRRLPGSRQRRGGQRGAGAATGRKGPDTGRPARKPGLFRATALEQALGSRLFERARRAVSAAPVRVFGRLFRLRRDAVPQDHHPAVRRPDDGGQRHRLFVHLRRQPAHDAVEQKRRWPRPGLVQLAVRGQRRVRHGLPPVGQSPPRPGRDGPAGIARGTGRRIRQTR